MSDINLIPKQTIDTTASTYKIIWLILGVILLAVVLIYSAGRLYFNSLNNQLVDYETSLNKFNQDVKEFERIRQEGDVLQVRLNTLSQLIKARRLPSKLMDFIFGLIDRDVKYTKLEFNITSGAIGLEGLARNYEAAARQMVTLQNDENITEAEFTTAAIEGGQEEGAGEIGVKFLTTIKLSDSFLDSEQMP